MFARISLLAALVSATLGWGCVPDPASPTPANTAAVLPLLEGRYELLLLGDSKACGDTKTPQAGTLVRVMVTATTTTDATWVARLVSASEVFEMRVRYATPPAAGGSAAGAVIGTIAGTITDTESPRISGVPISSATFANNTVIGGDTTGTARSFAVGTVLGTVSFAGNGVAATCPAGVLWNVTKPRT